MGILWISLLEQAAKQNKTKHPQLIAYKKRLTSLDEQKALKDCISLKFSHGANICPCYREINC